ncbi:unnamed protein product [Rotaria magnacalcarata]|uniref:FLYWCH-type domain-containing protein n=1 Tax=Rotaria magnacalcarata TaxID=392030 RepID=A0A820AKJ5_9BILA|nr:unnamed protein product [Rotaria magnacalcarata]
MPVTTRAAALRSHATSDATPSLKQATSAPTSSSKAARKCPSKQKQLKAQFSNTSSKPEASSTSQEQSTVSKAESTVKVIYHVDDDKHLETEVDEPFEDLSVNKPMILSASNENKESTSSHSPSGQSTTSSTEKTNNDDSLVSLGSLTNDENDVYSGDSNGFVNVPVIKGDITTGTSRRGGKMIFMNGCGYLYMSTAKQTSGWRCSRRDENCRVVIHTLKRTGEFTHWNGVFHSHTFDSNETRKHEIVAKMKNRVLDESIPIKVIIEEEYRKAMLSTEEKRAMTLPSQIESGLHKLRRKALPPLPRDQKFTMPLVYQETYSKENFLIYDKRKNAYGGRLIMFASNEQLDVLFNSDTLFADGTFKLAETNITGCWFHFCQSCYRNIQGLGLMKIYETDNELRHLLRAFMALALLPIDLIREAFKILKKKVASSSQANQLTTFVSYFQTEWIDHFKHSMWSVSNSTWRTNNFAESQNKRFFSRVVQLHPNLWRFIQCLKQEESVVSHRMIQTGLGFSSMKVT